MLELNSKEVCDLLNAMSNAAWIVRNETSSDKQDKMICYIYNKAIESLDVYPVVSLYYHGKTYRHIAKSDEEIIKNSTFFITEKIIDEYPPYSRLYKDYANSFSVNGERYSDCGVEYLPNRQTDDKKLLYTINFTLNGHKYGVDFNYAMYNFKEARNHIMSVYSRDLKGIEYYDKNDLPYSIIDIIDNAYKYFENMLLTDEVRQIIHTYIERQLNDLSVTSSLQSFN